jgi:hypothetical protein
MNLIKGTAATVLGIIFFTILVNVIFFIDGSREVSSIRYTSIYNISKHIETTESTKKLILDALQDNKITNIEYYKIYNNHTDSQNKTIIIKQQIREALNEQTTKNLIVDSMKDKKVIYKEYRNIMNRHYQEANKTGSITLDRTIKDNENVKKN